MIELGGKERQLYKGCHVLEFGDKVSSRGAPTAFMVITCLVPSDNLPKRLVLSVRDRYLGSKGIQGIELDTPNLGGNDSQFI